MRYANKSAGNYQLRRAIIDSIVYIYISQMDPPDRIQVTRVAGDAAYRQDKGERRAFKAERALDSENG